MRLIDADALKGVEDSVLCSRDYMRGWNDCIAEARHAPTVDAAPVVRCKDCEHSYEDIIYVDGVATCGRCCSYGTCCDSPVDDDFFCRDGKRKEDDRETD